MILQLELFPPSKLKDGKEHTPNLEQLSTAKCNDNPPLSTTTMRQSRSTLEDQYSTSLLSASLGLLLESKSLDPLSTLAIVIL
jgi:hypothetical protein